MTKHFLQQFSLFANLDELSLLAIADNLEKKNYGKNELIFREGQIANKLFMVFQGQVKVFKTNMDGKEHILHVMHPYDIIAEVPVFEGGIYPASCMAMTDSTLYAIGREKFFALVKKNPQIALNIIAFQAKRLREFTVKIEQLSLKTAEQKFMAFLLQHAVVDKTSGKNIAIIGTYSLQEIANYLGITREHLSRLTNKLIKNGTIARVADGFAIKSLFKIN